MIKGDPWVFEILTPHAYEKKHQDASGAICSYADKKVDFNGSFHLDYLAHEVMHIEAYYLCLESTTEITPGDVEEMFCTLMQRNLFKYHDRVLQISTEFVGAERTALMREELCK